MMIVLVVSDCPPKLRGDISKWLMEINTGVYVGNLNSRVRDEVWKRVCEALKNGRATMVFHTSGEQKLDFRIHNTTWEPVDFDGIKLVRRLIYQENHRKQEDTADFSKAANIQKVNKMEAAKRKKANEDEYIVFDLETTGFSCEDDKIIEIGAVHIVEGNPIREFSRLIRCEVNVPDEIVKLTGITNELLDIEGRDIKEAIKEFIDFIGFNRLVGYNVNFDQAFLQSACMSNQIERIKNYSTDILALARRKLDDVEDYKLSTIATYLELDTNVVHRALNDSYLTYGIYEKLKKM